MKTDDIKLNDTQWRLLAEVIYQGGNVPSNHNFIGLGERINKCLRFLVARELLFLVNGEYKISTRGLRIYEQQSTIED